MVPFGPPPLLLEILELPGMREPKPMNIISKWRQRERFPIVLNLYIPVSLMGFSGLGRVGLLIQTRRDLVNGILR